MKKLILLLVVMVTLPTIMQATGEEYWADINFTRDSVFWGQSANPVQPSNQQYVDRTFGDYLINGYFGRFSATMQKFNSENLSEKFITSWRLSRSVANQLKFPKYNNIGRLKIHYFNTSATYGCYIPLQYNNAADGQPANWVNFDPKIEFYVPADGISTSSSVIDTLLNLDATQIRIAPIFYATGGTGNYYLQVYSVSISKKGPIDQVEKNVMDNIKLSLTGRVLAMTGADIVGKASVFNLAGVKVGDFTNQENYTFNTPGHYIVRIETVEKTITRKIVVF